MEDVAGLRFGSISLPDGERPLAQGVEHGHFFRDRPRGELPSIRALALQNSGQVKGHGWSLGNCCSKRFHAAANPCRARCAQFYFKLCDRGCPSNYRV